MHIFYNNLTKNTRVLLFYSACLSLIIYFRIYPIVLPWIESIIKTTIPNWIKIPSYLALYHLIVGIYEKSLWKYAFFKAIGLPVIPDLNGKWTGKVNSSYDTNTTYSVDVEIRHNLSKFMMILKTNRSASETNCAIITIQEPYSKLQYNFVSRPSSGAEFSMNIHDGTACLELSHDTDALTGYYFTGRGRETYGDISLKRVNKHEF